MAGRIRSGSYGYTVGKDIGLVYLPLELEKAGVELGVEMLGKRINGQVAEIPLLYPKRERLRA